MKRFREWLVLKAQRLLYRRTLRSRVIKKKKGECMVLGVKSLAFRVQGSGFRVQGSGFRVQGSGSRV